LRSTAASSATSAECVKCELAVVAPPVVYSAAAAATGRVLRGRWRDASMCAATAPEPFGVYLWGRRRWSWWPLVVVVRGATCSGRCR
jgi:hypothetical protein